MANARKKDDLRQQEEIFGILLMTLALLVLISLVSYDPAEEPSGLGLIPIRNAMGIVGVYISYFLIKLLIGYSSVVIPFLLFAWGWNRFRGNDPQRLARITLFVLATALYLATIMGLPQAADPENTRFGFEFSGLVGGFFASKLYQFFGTIGSIIILISLAMVTVVAVTQFSFARIVSEFIHGVRVSFGWLNNQFGKIHLPRLSLPKRKPRMGRRTRHMPTGLDTSPPIKKTPRVPDVPEEKNVPPKGPATLRDRQPASTEAADQPLPADLFSAIPFEASVPQTDNHRGPEQNIKVTEMAEEKPAGEAVARPAAIGAYQFPGMDLLDYPDTQKPPVSKDELLANAKILEERLEEFGVEGNVVEINPGPVITRYEYEPAPGIKVSKITSLADDLALAMRAKRIRIVAPIPGKAAVGVELPNRNPQVVFLRSIIDTEEFQKNPSPLALALGKTISGKPYVTQLDQMPHLLVAGSTGSGKSVCLNTIIASILFKAHPTQVKFVLIDPKRLELSIYNKLINHHLIYREDLDEVVVTHPQNALAVLKSLVYEMEQRYDRLAEAGVRNIDDYNQRLKEGRIKHEDEDEPLLPLPRIVVIIDELADLMLMAAKEVEEPIARLTQMARAVGMHLIVATQRPSVDVITGVIKANFPSRIAFAVASKTDSRTILDMNGAEKLLGRGDMLFLPSGSPEPIRLHGAYISTEEIERILDHIQKQPRYPRKLLPVREEFSASGLDGFGVEGKRDALFKEALKLVVRHQQGSISLLQRRLKIGYARAARLIDELEAAGIVGGFDGSKAREVLITEEELEHMDLDGL
ncbi:MAG: DNA translocase FtsK [candidate division KSB1 bacterium]|nr:DNA translocase FtsK [candidate division KSB1 bacterium]